ncbi:glycosyl hydrolase [Krasilnikovia sp. MM14-A1259]|uniref:glycoside hydrolase family 26 protein n=1 Tax=Krasilnikovia sp. MM14-A1259 TaxID=3373539 RepID=UPI00382888E4
MSDTPRPGPRLTRRGVLGLGALAAVPAVTLVVHEAGSSKSKAAGPRAPSASPSQPHSSPAAPPVVTKGGGPVPLVAGKVLLGSYLALSGMTMRQSLELRDRQLGRPQRLINLFYEWTDNLPNRLPDLPERAVPMISWRGTKYSAVNGGAADALIARAARRIAQYGRPVMLRYAWEMNGFWFPWGGAKNDDDPDGYIACWRRVHRIFRQAGARNVSWVWSPNWHSDPAEDWNTPQAYYPGDEYVDWVGISGYNLHRESPETLFDGIYQRYATRKPIAVTEVGSVDRGGSTKADWITLFAQWVQNRPAVGAVTWFDTDTHPGYNEKWRIDTDPQSLAAYRAMATSERFSA